jgi:2-polyprenyl-3-methyl-5-hydroxy-6-metoxy-1,4-benzoquinol methylase
MGQNCSHKNWQEHFEQMGIWAIRDFRSVSIALKTVKLLEEDAESVLDIGCGVGVFVIYANLKGIPVLGIDISEAQIRLAKKVLSSKNMPTDLVKQCTVEDLAEEGVVFNSCVALDVLEHVSDPAKFLRTIKKLVAPGGRLIVSVPAIPEFYDERDKLSNHYLRYDLKTLRQHLNEGGFEIEKHEFWNLLGYIKRVFQKKVKPEKIDYYEFRYSKTLSSRVLNRLLMLYFIYIENRIRVPIGLTLFAVARSA